MRVLVGIVYGVAALGIISCIVRLIIMVKMVRTMDIIAMMCNIELAVHIVIATIPALSGVAIRWFSPRLKSKSSKSFIKWKGTERSKDLGSSQKIESRGVKLHGEYQASPKNMAKAWSHTPEQLDADVELEIRTGSILENRRSSIAESTEAILIRS